MCDITLFLGLLRIDVCKISLNEYNSFFDSHQIKCWGYYLWFTTTHQTNECKIKELLSSTSCLVFSTSDHRWIMSSHLSKIYLSFSRLKYTSAYWNAEWLALHEVVCKINACLLKVIITHVQMSPHFSIQVYLCHGFWFLYRDHT